MEQHTTAPGNCSRAVFRLAAALAILFAVIACNGKRPAAQDGPVYERKAQVIADSACRFSLTLPAGFTRVASRDADSTATGYANFYALGRDYDINIQSYPAFFPDSSEFRESDLATLEGVDRMFLFKGTWSGPSMIDLGGVKAFRCIGPHPAFNDAVTICYDIRNGRALVSCNVIYYTKGPARRPDWDKVRSANALIGSIYLY